jgi:uncharacterized membrane protein
VKSLATIGVYGFDLQGFLRSLEGAGVGLLIDVRQRRGVRGAEYAWANWAAEVGGHHHEWDALISEQKPDERIAWRNTDGKQNAGVVTFHRIDDSTTRLMVQLDYLPVGLLEKAAAALGALDRRVKDDLERFKEFIDEHRRPTGAFRGEIDQPRAG